MVAVQTSVTFDESLTRESGGVVRATRVSFVPGATPFTYGLIAKPPCCSRVRPPYSCHVPWSVKPSCCVPALDIIDMNPWSTPPLTHSAHLGPVPPDSCPRSTTRVTGPRQNGTEACWPARYVAWFDSWVKLRKLAFTEVKLPQLMSLPPWNIAWMTPGL